MLSPDYLSQITADVVALMEDFQNAVLADMARRFVRLDSLSQATIDQAEVLQEAGMLYEDVVRELSRLTGRAEREVQTLFASAGVKAIAYDDAVYRAAGLDPLPVRQSPWMLRILAADAQKTTRNLRNLTMTTAASPHRPRSSQRPATHRHWYPAGL